MSHPEDMHPMGVLGVVVFLFCAYFAGCGAAGTLYDKDNPKRICEAEYSEMAKADAVMNQRRLYSEIPKTEIAEHKASIAAFTACESDQSGRSFNRFFYRTFWFISLPIRGGAELAK